MLSTLFVIGAVLIGLLVLLALIVSLSARPQTVVRPSGSSGASLDLADMPAPIRDIVRAAYGDATAEIFLISAVIAVVALIAVLLVIAVVSGLTVIQVVRTLWSGAESTSQQPA